MMEKNLINIRKQFKQDGVFYTSSELAQTLMSYVDYTPRRVYDPTCGQGNLLAVFPDTVEKYGQELYQEELDKAAGTLANFHGYCGDTLTDDGFKGEKFDLIMANPPFSIKWTPAEDERFNAPVLPPASKADYAFILHILSHLSDDGKAIVLCFPGILYRGQREGKIRQWLVEQNVIERVVHVPGKMFADTTIATAILVLNKHKTTTDIVFQNLETDEEKTVSFNTVKDNGFTLSVSQYIVKEIEKPRVDRVELEQSARQGLIARVDASLSMSELVCAIDPVVAQALGGMDELYDEIIAVVEKHRANALPFDIF